MSVWAVLPVKPLDRGKSRLANFIAPEERKRLNVQLFYQSLQVLRGLEDVQKVWVVSTDEEVLALARKWKANAFREHGKVGLNEALEQITEYAKEQNVCRLLILPVDLPFVQAKDVTRLLETTLQTPFAVISPDRNRTGTNALLVCPPGALQYCFGEKSFDKHCNQANEKGLPLFIVDLPSLQFDLDNPEDYLEYRKMFTLSIDGTSLLG